MRQNQKSIAGIIFLAFYVSLLWLATSCEKKNDDSIVTDIDGNAYKSIIIGTQVWLNENLKTTKLNDGTPLQLEIENDAWAALVVPGYCWYDNNEAANKNTYGGLYNWAAANSGKLCPTGWHVPTAAEWTTLRDFLGGEAVAGGKLKERGTAQVKEKRATHWNSPNTDATDEVGFKALPGGERYEEGVFTYLGINDNFWTLTIGPNTDPYGIRFYNDSPVFHMSEFHKKRGLSVRCIKN